MVKSLDIIDPKRDLAPNEPDHSEDKREEKPSRENAGSGIFYLILGIIAVVVSTGLAVYILFKDSKSDTINNTTPTATASATDSASVIASASITTSATASVSATTAFTYTDESIRIVNGNGKNGEAIRIKTSLESKGFKIASTGNASKQYATSTILYKTGEEALANALKTAIAPDYSATIELSDQATLGTYDAVVALGSE